MELIKENTIRKIDSLGRIGVPKGMRNRMQISVNQEMEFYTLRDGDKEYVAFAPADSEETKAAKYLQVADLLNELGLEIPDEILDHI